MPLKNLENPFAPKKHRNKSSVELTRKILGDEAAEEMALLEGKTAKEESASDEIVLSEELHADIKQLELEMSPEYNKEIYINWAKEELGKDEDWVEEKFTFLGDGSVEVEGNLDLSSSNFKAFPTQLKIGGNLILFWCDGLTSLEGLPTEIGGDLDLVECTGLTSLEGLPTEIGGNLFLGVCTGLTSLDGLPTEIGGNLNLRGITVESIPEDIQIKGKIYINKDQTKLIKDAQLKGYNVNII